VTVRKRAPIGGAGGRRAFRLHGVALAISNGEVILIVVLVTLPIAALSFALGAGRALGQIGKGPLSVEFESDLQPEPRRPESEPSDERRAEIRQMLEAKAYRQRARGEAPLDVDAELEHLLDEGAGVPRRGDAGLEQEVRQLVVASNERRARQGKEPLDVEAEVQRRLRELESLGQ
jgi:hypothetical protein